MRKILAVFLMVAVASCTTMTPAFSGDGIHITIPEAQQCVRDSYIVSLVEHPPTAKILSQGGFLVDGLHVMSDPDDPIRLQLGWQDDLFYPVTIHPGIDVMVPAPAPSWWEDNDGTIGLIVGILIPIALTGLVYGATK